ncbi:hypothetical protein [Sphingorhabdus sp.]|jgi:hypothetical protein|uniref:hypothetical protein n=1 Tax=Sphingorhabdus sp. TaxID=1902408 RepID=UPI003BB13C39|nr:hypothetical protein [Sphingomonadales bacterium]
MSRVQLAIAVAAILCVPLQAQQRLSDAQITAMIEKQHQTVAADRKGCLKPDEPDMIVVCGADTENESQRQFRDRVPDENRPRRGEAVSTVRAACCSPIPKLPAGASASFGYVPPPVIPLEEVYRGLPEPDMIVQEGDGDVPKEGIPE